jgi:hypothetical protein
MTLGIASDRGGVADLSVSGDKSDLVVVYPHDLTTTSKPEAPVQSLNQLPVVTNNSCLQSKNKQELEASDLIITRSWSSES